MKYFEKLFLALLKAWRSEQSSLQMKAIAVAWTNCPTLHVMDDHDKVSQTPRQGYEVDARVF